MWTDITKGDYGSVGKIRLMQNGSAVDVSSYTTVQYIFEKPDGESLTVTGSFDSDGSDGIVAYTFQSGDLDQEGRWYVQVNIAKTGHSITSEKLFFYVSELID